MGRWIDWSAKRAGKISSVFEKVCPVLKGARDYF